MSPPRSFSCVSRRQLTELYLELSCDCIKSLLLGYADAMLFMESPLLYKETLGGLNYLTSF